MSARVKAQEFILGQRRRVLWEFVDERRNIDPGDIEDLADVDWIRWCATSSDYYLTDIGREQLPKDLNR